MVASLASEIIDLSYPDILKRNQELAQSGSEGKLYTIDILSNITVNPIKEVLEYSLRRIGLQPVIRFGNYDNIVQDSIQSSGADAVLLFYELINFSGNFHLQAELMDAAAVQEVIDNAIIRINLILDNLQGTPLVFFNKFSAYPLGSLVKSLNNLDVIARALNNYLSANKPGNVQLIDVDRIIAEIGIKNAIDTKKYSKYKLLYQINFLKVYVHCLTPYLLRVTGKLKKALIFDCDNTLWKGVLGEDGPEGIEMSNRTEHGSYYQQVQKIAAILSQRGVLVCLCSKNNPGDVEEIVRTHPDMVLRDEHIVSVKVNWNNKDENIRSLAQELNIGLDTFVFIDDSDFEITLIKQNLPEVLTAQVPADLSTYPGFLLSLAQEYFNLQPLSEDVKKVQIYKEQAKRQQVLSNVGNIDDYLATLQTAVVISKDKFEHIARVAQLTQKTNQFNLTTRRYTEGEIQEMVKDPQAAVFSIAVSDKFGDSGITGVAILKSNALDKGEIDIDTLLLSCRVLGRKIEKVFLEYLVAYAKKRHCQTITSRYIKTFKNEQVKDFFKNNQFAEQQSADGTTYYSLDIDRYLVNPTNFIAITEN